MYPVWEHVYNDECNGEETCVTPVVSIPVSTFDNRIFGLQVTFNNGEDYWAIIGNVDVNSKMRTYHLMSVNVWIASCWFPLARYFDVEYDIYGPAQLASRSGLTIADVFPIRYDFSQLVINPKIETRGVIEEKPTVKLTWEEILDIIVC